MHRLLAVIGLVLAAIFCSPVAMATPSDDFSEGNQAFQNKEYGRAVEAYTRIVQQGYESATVYYNLANSYFKAGDLGHAILYYMKAGRLNPTDQDIKNNLEFAKKLTPVQLEGAQLNPLNSLLESVVGPFKLNALAWVASLLFVLFIGFLIVRFGLGIAGSAVKAAIVISLVMLVLAVSLTSFKYHHDYVTRWGVVVGEEVQVLTGPSETSGTEFQGEPGLVVRILAESGEYYEVLFENQRQGWVKKSLVAEV